MKILYKNKGFTLVELIVVIAIVAILAAISMASYSRFVDAAKNSTANNELNQVYNVIYIDAAKPEELSEFKTSTEGGKLKFLFDGLTNEEIKDQLSGLLGTYLDAGFYQGEFIFTKNLLRYKSPGGGNAKREIVFGYDIEVHFYVEQDGSFSVTLTEKP